MSELVDSLLADADEGLLLGQSDAYTEASFDADAAHEAAGQIAARPDASRLGYRRKDYAFALLCRLLGREAGLDEDPARRDEEIASLTG